LLDVDLPPELRPDADLLCDALHDAGALGLTLFQQDVRNWSKNDGTVVTEADLKIDTFLKARLYGDRPDYGWLSEETPDDKRRLSCRRLWIVDPIDGTRAFVAGEDGWCIAAALIEDGRPLLSAIFRPVAKEFYFAARGVGAFCNHLPISPRDDFLLKGATLMATGKALKALDEHGVVGTIKPDLPLLMRLAFVAAGRTDIAMSFGNKNDWDLAAGDLLVQEAGARISTLDGTTMIYNKPQPWQNGMLAAGVNRHRAVMAQLEAK
jgi:myo-inositol-1(or 4)-monophosphatase